jgi:hypothetical protein
MATEFNKEKFKELLLHVASRMLGDPSYGSIKLNKVLFFSDNLHYLIYGESITGATYVRHRFGPAPKGIIDIQEELIADKDADLAVLQRGPRVQKILFPKRDAKIGMFSGTEIATVQVVLDTLAEYTAPQVSDLSHSMSGWKLASELEEIPYSAIFLYDSPITEDDILQGKNAAGALRRELENVGLTAA